jgi:hypothetical protein
MENKQKTTEKNGTLTICGFVHVCEIPLKICIHKEPHLFTDACKGMCKYMGYAECRKIKSNVGI